MKREPKTLEELRGRIKDQMKNAMRWRKVYRIGTWALHLGIIVLCLVVVLGHRFG